MWEFIDRDNDPQAESKPGRPGYHEPDSWEGEEDWDEDEDGQEARPASNVHPTTTSQQRYEARLRHFQIDGHPAPWLRHYGYWLLHNCVAHPLLGAFPGAKTMALHDLTSRWLNKQRNYKTIGSEMPVIPLPGAWAFHNIAAHIAIGLVPTRATFAFHDQSAKDMGIPGWV